MTMQLQYESTAFVTRMLIRKESRSVLKMTLETSQVENVFKILLIGDSGVGKSGLLLRFTEDAFKENYNTTIGADFKIRTIKLDGKPVKLEIWDTSGQERFRAITTNYYRKIHGVMIVYDITNKTSYSNLDIWLEEVARHTTTPVSKILIGNKSDLARETVIDSETAKSYSDVLGMPFLQTSVKYSINVEEAFVFLASQIMNNLKTQHSPNIETAMKLSTTPTKDKRIKNCCNI